MTSFTSGSPSGADSIWLSKGPQVDEDSDDPEPHEESDEFGTGVKLDVSAENVLQTDPAESEPDSTVDSAAEADVNAGGMGLLGQLLTEARSSDGAASSRDKPSDEVIAAREAMESVPVVSVREYEPDAAVPTESLDLLFNFAALTPSSASSWRNTCIGPVMKNGCCFWKALWICLGSVASRVRVPFPEHMPPGPMARNWLTPQLLSKGMATQEEITGYRDEDTGRRIPPLDLAIQMQMLFRSEFPAANDARCSAVWCIGDLLTFGGDFNKYVRARDLTKQEGIVFRHCLRMVLLCGEFAGIQPPGIEPADWQRDLSELASQLTETCRAIDPSSTDETLTALEQRQQETEIVL